MDSVFWPTAFGAAIGVVAGVLVQYFVQLVIGFQTERKLRAAFVKECKFNLRVVADVEEALRRFRNAVNGDVPQNAQTFVPCNLGLHVHVTNLVNTGKIYDFFSEEDLKRVQAVNTYLSAPNGQWFGTELEARKQHLMMNPEAKGNLTKLIASFS